MKRLFFERGKGMSRKSSGKFDQNKYIQDWQRDHMAVVSYRYSKDFVLAFREACLKLGVSQSSVVHHAMQEVIDYCFVNNL